MTPKERRLLEMVARTLLKLEREILPRIEGIEVVLKALSVTKGDTALALARIRVQADLLKMNGMPSYYLDCFLERTSSAFERSDAGT